MTNQQKAGMPVEEGNLLIAEFMELDYLEFNIDWRVLMPVLEKIEELGYRTKICRDEYGSWTQIHYGLSLAQTTETKALHQHGTKIENTWKAIVEFIQWYNTQTSNQ